VAPVFVEQSEIHLADFPAAHRAQGFSGELSADTLA
jgi:hypothetical protein